jgi:branched-chain amino acid transport system ATP-binding protein
VLEVDRLTTRYGEITALHGADLRVDEGEMVALVGPNGAGKTTLLTTVAGLVRPASGSVRFCSANITGHDPARLLRAGIALVPERRRIFKDLTVGENLRLAGTTVPSSHRRVRIHELCERFPILGERVDVAAGYLSGGEAQQLAVARALMCDPKLLLLDEPCLGLAPAMVDVVFELLVELRDQGRTILVVEQQAHRVIGVADRSYVLRTGRIVAAGGKEFADRSDLFASYVGGAA